MRQLLLALALLLGPDAALAQSGAIFPAVRGATGANPTATAGPAAVNGSATTFLRSDGAPAIQKATSGQFGIVEVDGTTITAASGVISATVGGRTALIADTDYYVNSSTGSDSNPCTSGSPCQTLAYTYNFLAASIDGRGFAVNIHLAGAGPYTLAQSTQTPWAGVSYVNIIGAGPTTTTINDLIFYPVVGSMSVPVITVNEVLLSNTNGDKDLLIYGGSIVLGATVPSGATDFPTNGHWALAPANNMISITNPFSVLNIYGTGTLNAGSSGFFIISNTNSFVVNFANSVTIQAGSTFNYFVSVDERGLIEDHSTYIGSPTSTFQFFAGAGGSLANTTGSPLFWPGDKLGFVAPGGYLGTPATVIASPTTGTTVVLSSNQLNQILTPAGTLAALTLQLPPAAVAFHTDGLISHVVSTQAITALTMTTTDGSSVVGAPSSIIANIPFAMQYNAANNAWYPFIESPGGTVRSVICAGVTITTSGTCGALTGDVTASAGAAATTVAKIAGVSVGTPTGTGNVVFSASPTFTGTIAAAAETLTGNLTTNVTGGGTQCLQVSTAGLVSGTGAVCGGSGSSGANPTATAGPAAVNGVATTYLRSDGAPAIQKATSGQFGIVEVDGTTITASGGVISAPAGAGTVTSVICGGVTITSSGTCGALTGDVTASAGAAATTVAKIAGVAVGTPTGTTNVVFSNGPTVTGATLNGVSTFGGAVKVKVRTASSTTDNISATADYFICADNSGGAATENLPAGVTGLTFLIKDCSGSAATNNIVVTPAAGNIDGAATFVMNNTYQSIAVTYTGSQWSVN